LLFTYIIKYKTEVHEFESVLEKIEEMEIEILYNNSKRYENIEEVIKTIRDLLLDSQLTYLNSMNTPIKISLVRLIKFKLANLELFQCLRIENLGQL
jgi:hypothetical protein